MMRVVYARVTNVALFLVVFPLIDPISTPLFQANIFSPFELSSLLYWKIVKKHLVDAEKNICKMKLVMIEEKVEFR